MSNPEFLYCSHCKKEVRYHFAPVNHWQQFMISLFSLGLWLPIWVCVTFNPSKICDECDNPIWNDPAPKAAAARRGAS